MAMQPVVHRERQGATVTATVTLDGRGVGRTVSSMASIRFLLPAFSALLLSACGSDDAGGTAPAAPSGLAAASLAGGAHLTWTDNSDNETEFMVMRMKDGVDTAFQHITTLEFNTTQYHDAPLTSGATYRFMVTAMNDAGESESNEVTFAAP